MPFSISQVAAAVEAHLKHESSGHDWQHIYRVWQTAQKLAEEEGANATVVSLAALLHDVDDRKVSGDITSEETLPTAHAILQGAGVPQAVQNEVYATIKSVGYSKSLTGTITRTREGDVLSDADRLDAIGAIGVARTFAYGGSKGRPMFTPDEEPVTAHTHASYVNAQPASLTHFFEKILKLKDTMQTASGKAEAQRRHARVVQFVEAFLEEAAAPAIWHTRLNAFR